MYFQTDRNHLNLAADYITQGEIIGFYFNGTYALLGDADQAPAATKIFTIKNRPRAKTLSLVTGPRYWADFIDLEHPALGRFPLEEVSNLYQMVHALGIVYPADLASAPEHLVQQETILNVWSDYEPLIALQQACLQRGIRAFLGASANLSGEPTITKRGEMVAFFGERLPLIFREDDAVPAYRQKSTSLVDFTGDLPMLIREGNVPKAEVQGAMSELGLGQLVISKDLKLV